jgi:tight adherence protein B
MAAESTGNLAPLLALPIAVLTALAVGFAAAWFVPAWDELASRRIAGYRPRLAALGLDDVNWAQYLRLWGLAMVAAALGPWLILDMPLLGVPLAVAAWSAPPYLLERRIARRESILRDQMTSASVALANAVRAGMSLADGLESVAAETPDPLATELRRIVADYHRGRPLGEAINAVRQRLDLDSFRLFSSALLVNLDRGGRVADTLVQIGRTLQENQRLERQLEADTAGGRKLIVILGIFPLVFLAVLMMMDSEGTGVQFRTIAGQVVLVVVLALIAVAVKVARRILAIEI